MSTITECSAAMDALTVEELKLEESTLQSGIATYRERLQRLRKAGCEDVASPGMIALATCINPIRDGLIKWLMKARRAPGRRVLAYPIISELDPDTTALLALRLCLARPGKRRFQSLAVAIGDSIRKEVWLGMFEGDNQALYKAVDRHIARSPRKTDRRYRERVFAHAARTYKIAQPEWSDEIKCNVGGVLIDLIVEHTGLFAYEVERGRKGGIYVVPTPAFVDWTRAMHDHEEALKPLRGPMVCPPLPFSNLKDGGYLSPKLRRRLCPQVNKDCTADFTRENMPIVFDVVNAVQDVAYVVNRPVYDVLLTLWSQENGHVPGLVSREDLSLPDKPPANASLEQKREYKAKAREVGNANVSARSVRISVAQTFLVARSMLGRKHWYPVYLDFRGRLYSVPYFLSPQSNDLGRGLLQFADAKRLGASGLRWLKIHTANSYGVDKVSFDERVKWVDDRLADIQSTAAEPFTDRFWHTADAPVQFLAAAMELRNAILHADGPEEYKSALPITVDGTCNGLQHLAALSRDRDAGQYVNLLPTSSPSDIYKRVATRANELLAELIQTSEDGEEKILAELWQNYGIDRSLCKRPTMIFPYGGTLSAVERYLDDEITERMKGGKPHPFGSKRVKASRILGRVIWTAVNDVVRGPREIMRWTRKTASTISKQQKPIVWTTPSGWVVYQARRDVRRRQVRSRMGDKVIKLRLVEEIDRIDPRRQAQALSPNWTHSMDAACLHLTVYRLFHDHGLRHFLTIHDCYGTHAADMDTLAKVLREIFVEVYSTDQIAKFLADITTGVDTKKIQPPPQLGDLDVRSVLDSPYFFA